jgi:prephenate dehydratase
MRVAFQGEAGAFSEEAVEAFFEDAEPVGCASFEDVFAALENEDADRAAIPIENSLHGSVHANYDLLRTREARITGEHWMRIRHYLMARPGASLDEMRRVRSHPQALGQCRAFLRERMPQAEVIPAHDTAGAAREVADSEGDNRTAAIASRRAADEYGLAVLAEDIESNPENYTRFLALARPGDAPSDEAQDEDRSCKTSLVFALNENVPGALFKSLAVFALRELDLFKIESRPLIGTPGEYVFYLDVEGAAASEPVRRALGHLREITSEARVLGSYPVD